jgi:ABC-2 type transport system permease protein
MAHHAADATQGIAISDGTNMRKFIQGMANTRFVALIRKEFSQIRRDRRMTISLIVPPILMILFFGYVLNPIVKNLQLGVVDESRTPESRELIATLSESESFAVAGSYLSARQLEDAIGRGKLTAGVVIPYDFGRNLERGRPATVQFLLNAMDANTARIAQAYAESVIAAYNSGLRTSGMNADFRRVAPVGAQPHSEVLLYPAFLYNPGLVSSWFVVTGVFGMLCILNASIVSAAAMVKEREAGTLEQLMMSPAGTYTIVAAKIVPLFLLLCLMVLGAVGLMKLVFQVPFRGGYLLVMLGAALCVLCGIGIGTFIATFTKTAAQAQLTSFFVNPPLSSLSGALTPAQALPAWMRPLTNINPIYHFGIIARGSMLRGSGLDTLWPNFLALLAFTLILVSLSVWRFRKQLS